LGFGAKMDYEHAFVRRIVLGSVDVGAQLRAAQAVFAQLGLLRLAVVEFDVPVIDDAPSHFPRFEFKQTTPRPLLAQKSFDDGHLDETATTFTGQNTEDSAMLFERVDNERIRFTNIAEGRWATS
jgi:hypothetical protein